MTALAEPAPAVASPRRGRPSALRWLGVSLLVAVVAGLGWRMFVWGMADWLAADGEDPHRVHAALHWVADHPRALFLAAQHDLEHKPAEAREHLEHLLRLEPGHAWGWLLLAELTLARNETLGRRYLETAQRFAPWDGNLHLRAGNQWLRLGELSRSVAAWDRAMAASPALRRPLFGQLETLLNYLGQVDFLETVARRQPVWWADFFRYVARPPTDLELVRALYALEGAEGEARMAQRRVFLDRLIREGHWQEAYLTWLNALSSRERRHLGLVFNGGFELPLSNLGFGWRTRAPQAVKIEHRRTYGISGDRALALHYRGRAVPDGHLAQYLLLPPGRYRLQYRARPDSLKAEEGVRIAIHCRGGRERRLASGQRLLGVYQWRMDVVEWTVPETGCPAQELRLDVVTERHRNREVKGVLWLDDFRLRPVGGQ